VLMLIRCFIRSESGVTLVEYGVVAAIIGLLIMMSMSTGNS
jgi:Flp pilus assembly pilin Flp